MLRRPEYGKSAIQAEEKGCPSVEGVAFNYLKIIRSSFLSGAAVIGFGISAANAQQSGTGPSGDVSQVEQAGTQASSQAPASPATEQVVVSASRISVAGYQAPTPVTVVPYSWSVMPNRTSAMFCDSFHQPAVRLVRITL